MEELAIECKEGLTECVVEPQHVPPGVPVPYVLGRLVVRVVFEGQEPGEDEVRAVREGKSREVRVGRGFHPGPGEYHDGQQVAHEPHQAADRLDRPVYPHPPYVPEHEPRTLTYHGGDVRVTLHRGLSS